MDILLLIFYISATVSLYISAVVFLISGLDDFFVDLYYLIYQSYKKFYIFKKHQPLNAEERDAVAQRSRCLLGIAIQGWKSLGWKGSGLTKLMLFKDRKPLVTNLTSFLAYLAFSYFIINLFTWKAVGYTILPPLVKTDSWIFKILIADLAFMVVRLFQRGIFVGKLYGTAHGIVSIPRALWGSIINFCATLSAIYQYAHSLIFGAPLEYSKPKNDFPTEEQLKFHHRQLGEIMLEKKIIRLEQLKEALKIQKESKEQLGAILVRLGYLEDEDLAISLANQFNYPCEELEPYETAIELLEVIPKEFCDINSCYPVRNENGHTVLATCILENFENSEQLETKLAHTKPLKLVLTSEPDITFAIERGYKRLENGSRETPDFLGQTLLETDLITPEQLKTALRVQKRTNDKLGDVLAEMKWWN